MSLQEERELPRPVSDKLEREFLSAGQEGRIRVLKQAIFESKFSLQRILQTLKGHYKTLYFGGVETLADDLRALSRENLGTRPLMAAFLSNLSDFVVVLETNKRQKNETFTVIDKNARTHNAKQLENIKKNAEASTSEQYYAIDNIADNAEVQKKVHYRYNVGPLQRAGVMPWKENVKAAVTMSLEEFFKVVDAFDFGPNEQFLLSPGIVKSELDNLCTPIFEGWLHGLQAQLDLILVELKRGESGEEQEITGNSEEPSDDGNTMVATLSEPSESTTQTFQAPQTP